MKFKHFAVGLIAPMLLASCGKVTTDTGNTSSEANKNEYTITWKNYDDTILEVDPNVEEGTIPTYDGATPKKPSDEHYTYTFNGWNPEVVAATSDQTYTAIYTSDKITYTIEFDLNGGTSPSYEGPQNVESFTKDVFFFDCVKEGVNFRGWEYNGTKIFDEKGNQLANPMMAPKMVFTAMYANTSKLSISTNLADAGTVTGDGEYAYNTIVNLSACPDPGYKFIGWFRQGNLLSDDEDFEYMVWDQDVDIEARFELDSFTLEVKTSNPTYGLVILKSDKYSEYKDSYTEDLDYMTETAVAASSLTDVRFLGWYDDSGLVSTNVVYKFVMPSHDYSLEAKWNHFTVSYNLNGGTQNPLNPTSYTIDDEPFALLDPEKKGYTFLGWKLNDAFVTSIDPQWTDDVTLEAVWEATSYSITYHLNGGENSSSNPISYDIEDDAITLAEPSKEGYTFAGWYSDSSFNEKFTTIEKGSTGDLDVYAKWDIVAYSITYNLNGGTNPSSNPTSYTVEDDTITFAEPSRTGYAFLGWYENGEKIDSIEKGSTGDISIEARWDANKNNLSVTSEDESRGTVSVMSGSGYSGESITVVASPSGDYAFKGWYNGTAKVSISETYTFTMPTSDYSLTARFYTKLEKTADEEDRNKNLAIVPTVDETSETVTYGLYPQTLVNDSETISTLDSLTSPDTNGWYFLNDEYYAKKTASPYKNNYVFRNGTKIVSGATYWFKCEPIEWKILSSDNGKYSLVSTVVLDAHRYDDSLNNYKNSEIREWLKGDFYNSAFSLDNSFVQTTTVDNSGSTTGLNSNSYACANTDDKVYLLSYKDYVNTSYFTDNASRQCKPTDYARAGGANYSTISAYLNNGWYWTRSPNGGYSNCARTFATDGDFLDKEVNSTFGGVRPALTINL